MAFHQAFLGVEQPLIGQFVRELRLILKLTQEKFAALLGVTFPTINRWENGHAMPSRLALKQIDALLQQLEKSSDPMLREQGQALRTKYLCDRTRINPGEEIVSIPVL